MEALSKVGSVPSGNGTKPKNNQYETNSIVTTTASCFQLKFKNNSADIKNTTPIRCNTPGNLTVSKPLKKGKYGKNQDKK